MDVEVVAAEPGEDYNIDPSTFSVPGLAGSPRYTAIYGESFEPMKGGKIERSPQVTPEDIEKAKQQLVDALIQEGKKAITKEVDQRGGFLFLEKTFAHEIGDIVPMVSAGAVVEQFQVQGQATFKAFIFKKEDLDQLLAKLVESQVGEGKKVKKDSIKTNFSEIKPDWENGRLKMTVEGNLMVYEEPDIDNLKQELAGKKLDQAKNSLEAQPSIVKAEIKLWPPIGWKIPNNPQRIKVVLSLD